MVSVALVACGDKRPTEPESSSPEAPAAACAPRWDELASAAPPRLELAVWSADRAGADECPSGFEPDALLAAGVACESPGCVRGAIAPDRPAVLMIEGPAGSGRFVSLGLAVTGEDGTLFVCTTASTVAWRHLHRVADQLTPLPWLDDLDHDGVAELIVWQRVPWGDSESQVGMAPAIYGWRDGGLARRDGAGRVLAGRVAGAYRTLADDSADPDAACYRAIADELDRAWR